MLDIVNANHYHLIMSSEYRCKLNLPQQVDTLPHAIPACPGACPARISSRQLLGERGDVFIEHQGREYRLQLTKNGKLILTA